MTLSDPEIKKLRRSDSPPTDSTDNTLQVQSKLKFKVGGWWQVLVYIQQAENIKHFIAKKTFYYSAKFPSSQRAGLGSITNKVKVGD